MRQQGRCSAPAQDALDILDRLEGLSKVIAPEIMEQALLETGRGQQRACRLSHRVTLWVLEARGVKMLVRVKGNMVFNPIQRLPDGSYLAKIYPSSYARAKDRDGIVVRVIEYTLDDPQRTGPSIAIDHR